MVEVEFLGGYFDFDFEWEGRASLSITPCHVSGRLPILRTMENTRCSKYLCLYIIIYIICVCVSR